MNIFFWELEKKFVSIKDKQWLWSKQKEVMVNLEVNKFLTLKNSNQS